MGRLTKNIIFVIIGTVIVLSGVSIVLFSLLLAPTNSRDNNNAVKQAEMVKLILESARLAPFPANEDETTITTEGNMFTRSFRAIFHASDEDVASWIKASPGLRDASVEQGPDGSKKYVISPSDDANYAEMLFNPNTNEVKVSVSYY